MHSGFALPMEVVSVFIPISLCAQLHLTDLITNLRHTKIAILPLSCRSHNLVA